LLALPASAAGAAEGVETLDALGVSRVGAFWAGDAAAETEGDWLVATNGRPPGAGASAGLFPAGPMDPATAGIGAGVDVGGGTRSGAI
jgi:hypothetical protein